MRARRAPGIEGFPASTRHPLSGRDCPVAASEIGDVACCRFMVLLRATWFVQCRGRPGIRRALRSRHTRPWRPETNALMGVIELPIAGSRAPPKSQSRDRQAEAPPSHLATAVAAVVN